MRALALASFAVATAACGTPQQITLSIDTNVGIPCEVDKIRVVATGSDEAVYERDIADVRLPLVVKLQDETSNGSFALAVLGMKGNTEVLRTEGQLVFGSSDASAHIVLESTCTPDNPCSLPMLSAGDQPFAPLTQRFDCGTNVQRYRQMPSGETFLDACTVASQNSDRILDGDNERGATLLTINETVLNNFNFRFYGKPIRQIWAHEDGYISFAAENPDPGNDRDPGAFDRNITGVGVPPPVLSAMVFWDSLVLTDGICYALEGAPGTQKLRVTWAQTCTTTPCGSDSLNFTIVLDERTNRVSFTYGPMMAANTQRAQGSQATVGLVNNATGCPANQCTLATGLCTDLATPCGYTQVFSKAPQAGGIPNYAFDPILDGAQ